METLIINLTGFVLIAVIVWWFWLSKAKTQTIDNDAVEILVDNGVYTPSRIEANAGQSIKLRFLRKDGSPCAEKVIFEQLRISADLPLNKTKEIEVTANEAGEYAFACSMQMYKGSLVVK